MLAKILRDQFVAGIYAALVALHDGEISPFEVAYEGSPAHDFVGRLEGWEWPAESARS